MKLNANFLQATLNIIKLIKANKSHLSCFFQIFPFNQLTDITIMDPECINLCSKVFKHIITEEVLFIEYPEKVEQILQFVCVTLSSIKHESKEIAAIMHEMLATLVRILENANLYLSATIKMDFITKEPIYEALHNCTKSMLFNHSSSQLCVAIVLRLIKAGSHVMMLNDLLYSYVCQLFERCRDIRAERELCIITKIILEKLHSSISDVDIFRPVYNWLNEECYMIIVKQTDVGILHDLLYCLTIFIHADTSKPNLIRQNLKYVLSKLCQFNNEPKLRRYVHRLLHFILSHEKDVQLDFEAEEIYSTLKQLPNDYKEWSKSENNLFYKICSIVMVHDKMVWDNNEIICALSKKLRATEIIPTSTLKSMWHIYPLISNDFNDIHSLQVSNSLLNLWWSPAHLNSLVTLHPAQFRWIMKYGTEDLKKSLLHIWIRDYKRNRKLCCLINSCNVGILLVDILLESNDTGISEKVISLLKALMNQNITEKIVFCLPETTDARLFANLLRCNPGVPEESRKCLLLCTLMISMVGCCTDQTFLCNVCKYSMKLVERLKDDPSCIERFCEVSVNIKLLLKIATDANTTTKTAVDILALLVELLRMQTKTKPPLHVVTIEYNLTGLLLGSPKKILKALQLLKLLIISKRDLFIKMKMSSMLETYHMLLDLSENDFLSASAFNCLRLLVKKENWLALTELTFIYIEMQCLTVEDNNENLLIFLVEWMEIMRSSGSSEIFDLPANNVKEFMLRHNNSPLDI